MLDSLLDQVDWLEVAIKVARNRAPSIYCNAIEKILLAHIYQLVKIEGEDDDAAQFENGNNEQKYVPMHEGDDEEEDEIGSETARKSEDEDGDSDEDDDDDNDDDEDMEGDKHEDEDDEMNNDEYDEDGETWYKE